MNLSDRIQTEHSNGKKALAPFIALTEEEQRLVDGTGIFYAVAEDDQIVAIYKKSPINRSVVSRDEAIQKSGAKGWCKSAKFEYHRLMRDEQIREFELTNEWHKSVVDSGKELWRGVFSTTHLSKPEEQEYAEIPKPTITEEQAEAIGEIIEYLDLIYQPLKKEFSPVDFDRRITLENYKRIVPMSEASKNLRDFLKHVKTNGVLLREAVS